MSILNSLLVLIHSLTHHHYNLHTVETCDQQVLSLHNHVVYLTE